MDRDAVRILDEGVAVGGDGSRRLVAGGVSDDDLAGSHAGHVPGLVVVGKHRVFPDLAVRQFHGPYPIGEAGQVHDPQLALAQRRDVSLAQVPVIKDVVRHQVGRQRDVVEDLPEIPRLRIDVDDGDAFRPIAQRRDRQLQGLQRVFGLALVIDHCQDLGAPLGDAEAEKRKRGKRCRKSGFHRNPPSCSCIAWSYGHHNAKVRLGPIRIGDHDSIRREPALTAALPAPPEDIRDADDGRSARGGLTGRIAFILVLSSAWAGPARAHGFAQPYDLPIPLWLYLAAAATAVAGTFVVMVAFRGAAPGLSGYPRLNLLRFRVGRALAHPAMLFPFRALSVAIFVLIVVAGLIGTQNPFKNIAPTLVWVVWWVGVTYISALVGDVG